MNRTSTVILCIALQFVFASCSSFVSEKLLRVKKGSTTSEVQLADEDLIIRNPVPISGEGLDSKAVYSMIVSEMPAADNDNIWIYGFKDNKLFFWGYPYQFQRNVDNEIRIFGELATKYLVEQEYLKSSKQ